MDDFNELKSAFSHERLTVIDWCMDGGRARYVFKAHPPNLMMKEGFTSWAWNGTKAVLYVLMGCIKRFSVIRSALQNRATVFEVCAVVTAAVALWIHFR
ncbi:MAG: hypothetical protein JRJ46_05825 [Deltaproteobacteria bacterium]|nr:hypothetical protein [Deltaproteobacteria bacterium]